MMEMAVGALGGARVSRGTLDVWPQAMITPQIARWGQTPLDVYRLSVEHPAPRTRERYMALSKILDGQPVWRLAPAIGRSTKAVYTWLKRYNESGPEGLEYRHTGGRQPSFRVARG